MDDIDDFFSPEALRLLDNSPRPALQPNDHFLLDQVRGAAPPCQTQTKRKDIKFPVNIPGCSTLNIGNGIELKRKRGKFDDGDRKETASVRRKGVCMRCGILSIRVSFFFGCITRAPRADIDIVFRKVAMPLLHCWRNDSAWTGTQIPLDALCSLFPEES